MTVALGAAVFVSTTAWAQQPSPAPQNEESGDPAEQELSPAEQEARQLFNAGRIAFNDGRFDDALEYFERSYELSGRPILLFNIGAAADRQRQNQRALDAFEAYLAAVPDAPNRREVEGRIRVLRRAIVATPTEAAEQSEGVGPAEPSPVAPAPEAEDDDGGSVLTAWWLWTAIGAVVVGGVVAVILLTQDDDGGQNDELLLGDDGVVHFTLGAP